ncbi:hypothetical protein [Pseudorhodoplanes sp.]|uniref:hypothetical protein n=1 Tax=Pseudorhodoplanes sp. TaxID=1934341 RepID=UPI003D10D350
MMTGIITEIPGDDRPSRDAESELGTCIPDFMKALQGAPLYFEHRLNECKITPPLDEALMAGIATEHPATVRNGDQHELTVQRCWSSRLRASGQKMPGHWLLARACGRAGLN